MAVTEVVEVQVGDLRWGSFVLLGFLAILFGIVIALFPGITTAILIELIGIFVILVSFGAIVVSAFAPKGLAGSLGLAILGIVGFFFGLATVLSPVVMGQVIFILAGIALFIGGLSGIILALTEKALMHRGIFALQALLSIILGLLIVIGPAIGAALLVILIGVYFVFWGILAVIAGATIRSAAKAS